MIRIEKRKEVSITIVIFVAVMILLSIHFNTTSTRDNANAIQNMGNLMPSNTYHNQQLNGTTTNINYSISLQGYSKYNFQLAVPSGCDFDLFLYNSSNTIVAESATPVVGPMNESFTYRNAKPTGNFKIQVNRTSGNGYYNLTFSLIPDSNPPVLSGQGVDHPIGPHFQTFNFSTRYSDAYGNAPVFINVYINGNVQHLARNVQTGNNYTTGVEYYTVISNFSVGYYPFYFKANDGWYNNTISPTFHVNVTDTQPRLSNYGSNRTIGPSTITYNFSARYSDVYGNAPAYIDVVINGSTQHLSRNIQTGTNYTHGVVYYKTLSNFTTGYYPFNFQTGDGWFTNSASINHVNVTNKPPRLYNFGVSPVSGIIFQSYNFSTRYSDVYGNAPAYIDVVINGVPYHLLQNMQTGSNYSRGVVYYITISNFTAGYFPFYFSAGDGWFTNTTSASNVNVTKPLSWPLTTSKPYVQNFDPGWNSTKYKWESSASLWTVVSITNPSANVMSIQAPNLALTTEYLYSPWFDLTMASSAIVSLEYQFVGITANLAINVNMTGTWTTLQTFTSAAGTWTNVQIDISQYMSSYVQFRVMFMGITSFLGTNYLYIGNFQVHTLNYGTPSFTFVNLTPSPGNLYSTFTLTVRYRETNNNFPTQLYMGIQEGYGNLTFARTVNFVQSNPSEWSVSGVNGKGYYCNFQVFDIPNPYLVCVCNEAPYIFPMTLVIGNTVIYDHHPDTSTPVDTANFPYSLDFENSSPYYTMDNHLIGTNTITTDGSNHNFQTSSTTGTSGLLLGLVTPLIPIKSQLQVFMAFDMSITSLVPLIGINGNTFSIYMSIDNGSTFNITLTQYAAAFTGHYAVNLTAYGNTTVCFRFVLSTGGFIITAASWVIDNISVYEVDKTPPIMTLNIGSDQRISGTIPVNITVHDIGFGVSNVIVYLDDQLISNFTSFKNNMASFMLDTTKFSYGNHNLTVTVIDTSGNKRTYVIPVVIDNTPYWLYGIILGVIAVAIIIGIIAIKKSIPHVRKIPKYLNKRIVLKQIEPSKDVAEKILKITGVFRHITARDLARKLELPSVNPGKVLGYLRFMLAAGMIHGDLDEETRTYNRTYPVKMKALLMDKEDAILGYISSKESIEIGDLITDLQLEKITRDVIENYIMDLVTAGKINYYFYGDTIIKETEPTKKINEIPAAPAPAKPVKEIPIPKSSTSERLKPRERGAKLQGTLGSKEGTILDYLKAREMTTFGMLIGDLQLESFDQETIEDFIIKLIIDGKIKCHIDGNTIIIEERRAEPSVSAAAMVEPAKIATATPRKATPRKQKAPAISRPELKEQPITKKAPSTKAAAIAPLEVAEESPEIEAPIAKASALNQLKPVAIQGRFQPTLARKKEVILDYLKMRETTSFSALISDLQLENSDQEAIEDLIMSLVDAGKLQCHFDGDTIVVDAGYVESSAPAIPVIEPTKPIAATPKKAIQKKPKIPAVAKPASIPPPKAKPAPSSDVGTIEPSEEIKKSPEIEAQIAEAKPQKAKVPEKKKTIGDKRDELLELLASREKISFEEVKETLGLAESTEEIEDFLFELIKNREIKGIIQDESFSPR